MQTWALADSCARARVGVCVCVFGSGAADVCLQNKWLSEVYKHGQLYLSAVAPPPPHPPPQSGITRAHCLSHPSVRSLCACVYVCECVCDLSWNSVWIGGNGKQTRHVSLSSLGALNRCHAAVTEHEVMAEKLDVLLGCCKMLPAVRPNITSGWSA